jgi:hypothetical protein
VIGVHEGWENRKQRQTLEANTAACQGLLKRSQLLSRVAWCLGESMKEFESVTNLPSEAVVAFLQAAAGILKLWQEPREKEQRAYLVVDDQASELRKIVNRRRKA